MSIFPKHLNFFLFHKILFFILYYFNILSLGANKENLLHVTHYIVSSLPFSLKLYQGYFNMSCHWHMNMCCLIKLHVNMLTLFQKILTKEQMSMQKVRMEKCIFHFACENNHDWVVSILCMVFNFLFTSFFALKIIIM